jgi:hypothetical protein
MLFFNAQRLIVCAMQLHKCYLFTAQRNKVTPLCILMQKGNAMIYSLGVATQNFNSLC